MWISRLRVTGGFLADVDLAFGPGLNVVIGPRGAGKTTLLELMRHALGIAHADRARGEAEARRIRSLLGAGEVVVDIEDSHQSHRVVVDADGGGRQKGFSDFALMLGQNELEAIASNAQSRLHLIDLRAQLREDEAATDVLRGFTEQLAELREKLADLDERLRTRPLLEADLSALSGEESEMMRQASAELTSKREQLRGLESRLLQTQVETLQLKSASEAVGGLSQGASSLQNGLLFLKDVALPSELSQSIEARLDQTDSILRDLTDQIGLMEAELDSSLNVREQRELELRAAAEPIRAWLNEAERGLGELTAKIRNIQAQLAALDEVRVRLSELGRRYTGIYDERASLLDELESANERRYHSRLAVANAVSQRLGDRVTVTVEHLAEATDFKQFLLDSLQGSGIKYSALADSISRSMLPRQLLDFVERGDAAGASAVAGVPEDRMARVLSHLDDPETLGRLASIQLDDRADFLLQDGTTLKSVETLSTGQKCAVTLPILLTEHSRTLILDQPEDHLDNAYLVGNIVSGLIARSGEGAQTLIATHNANIPVLGSAERVFLLNSDGRRGFVARTGRFDHPQIVDAITTLMEGGADAFRRRAEFYRAHGINA